MLLTDLQKDEALALGGLVRLMIRADGRFSEAEEAQVNAIGADIGGAETFWRCISESAQALKTEADVRRAAKAISRREAQEFIYDIVTSVAVVDALSPAEEGLLDQLRSSWNIDVD